MQRGVGDLLAQTIWQFDRPNPVASRRRDHTVARPGALSIRSESGRHRRSVAARQSNRIVVARPDGEFLGGGSEPSPVCRARVGFRRRPVDHKRRRSTRACPFRCSPRRSTNDSHRGARRITRTSCSLRCAFSSAGIWRNLRNERPRFTSMAIGCDARRELEP